MVKRVSFIDPFAAGEPPLATPSTKRPRVPAPPSKPLSASGAVVPRGREREVQQLIYDLAVLAARHQPPES